MVGATQAKFRVMSVSPNGQVVLQAVSDTGIEEDKRFHKYTPCGKIELSVDNPPALSYFNRRLEKNVYVDFTDAP